TYASWLSSYPQFVVSVLGLPLTLASRQWSTFTVTFPPQVAGTSAARLSIPRARYGVLGVAVSGQAVTPGALTLTPPSLSFGSVGVGQSAAKIVTLTNSGGSSVTVSQASVSNAVFTISGLSLPVTLAAKQTATSSVPFAPKSSGSVNGSVMVTRAST